MVTILDKSSVPLLHLPGMGKGGKVEFLSLIPDKSGKEGRVESISSS